MDQEEVQWKEIKVFYSLSSDSLLFTSCVALWKITLTSLTLSLFMPNTGNNDTRLSLSMTSNIS